MLLTRLPRVPSAQTSVAPLARDSTARWLPSMTLSPLNEPTIESNGGSETTAAGPNDRPPSEEEATTTSARTSSGSRLRS